MWIVIKLVVAVVAGLIRLFSRQLKSLQNRTPHYIHENIPVFIRTEETNGQISATTFIIELKSRALFRLTHESKWDKLFKRLGISSEIQSGDKHFDDNIYIACDHPIFGDEIQGDEITRKLILELFSMGAERITGNGDSLEARFALNQTTKFDIAHKLAELQISIATMDMHRPSFWGDPYIRKAFAIEIFIWTFAGYALSGFAEIMFRSQDIYLYPIPIYVKGLLLGVLIAAVLTALIAQLFKGSSRGHRILIETGIVLGLSLPLGGMNLFSDLNRELDKSEAVWVDATVTQTEERVRRTRRGGRSRSYYLHLAQTKIQDYKLPSSVQVDRSTFNEARPYMNVHFEVHRGWLGHPWFDRIRFSNANEGSY